MRLGVNVVGLPPRLGGIEDLYLRHVLGTLRDLGAATDITLFTDPANDTSFSAWNRVCVGAPGAFKSIEQAVKSVAPEVVFSSMTNAPLGVAAPLVLYALDLHGAENGSKRHWFGSPTNALKRAAHAAVAVVVPSKFMQQECLRVLDLPMDKVVVAPLGADSTAEPAQGCFAQRPFFLAVGDPHEIDDVSHIINAMAKVPQAEEHILVVVGAAFNEDNRDWGPKVLRIEHLPDNHLLSLYRDCDAYIYPALHSGTALGVLQALRAGARVVAPRVGGIPEAAGTTPLYFDPASKPSLVSAIQRALNEGESERATKVKIGRQTAAAFTWESCAWKTLTALRRA